MTSENTDLPPVPYRPFIRARASLGYPIPVPMVQTHRHDVSTPFLKVSSYIETFNPLICGLTYYVDMSYTFFNFNNSLFLDNDCGHKLTHTNKNEISINLFPVCYQSLSIIFFCSRLVKSHTPQRFVLRHCLKNLTMGNPVK